jgi:hypothetical protein
MQDKLIKAQAFGKPRDEDCLRSVYDESRKNRIPKAWALVTFVAMRWLFWFFFGGKKEH